MLPAPLEQVKVLSLVMCIPRYARGVCIPHHVYVSTQIATVPTPSSSVVKLFFPELLAACEIGPQPLFEPNGGTRQTRNLAA